MNLVFVKHRSNKNSKSFLFEIPEIYTLKAGDIVRVDTKRGERVAECAGNSFKIEDENAVRVLTKELGGVFPLRRVIGIYSLRSFDGAWDVRGLEGD